MHFTDAVFNIKSLPHIFTSTILQTVHCCMFCKRSENGFQNNNQGPGLQCLFKFKGDLKLRTESLAYENGHLEISEIKTISCIL